MTNSRQVISSETHDGSLYLIMTYHVADLWTDENGQQHDEGYDYCTLEVFDLSNGQLVITERGDLQEMEAIKQELMAELVA